jgi:hypothetical protein
MRPGSRSSQPLGPPYGLPVSQQAQQVGGTTAHRGQICEFVVADDRRARALG